ncbi:WG repeat-containing protein [Hymenobacter cellulosivorans]|uniref:WG repeat-containing protein n=1 Tax=Hymenobacter cellulosivorans TaxID=2932249 RepID=A0ABY4FCB7_9BACT|nr:WG repeat-containing protein [Hymenobacter cellulosivorans]UOQ53727.1 WG repeat-containing protein [Hymenobacter cellulosivorans]
MLHVFLLGSFSDSARREQFEAVRAALAAEPNSPPTLLLGNVPGAEGEALDAVVLRPHLITILVLEPRGGRLTIRDFAHAAWQLNGAPLTGAAAADNPFQQFLQQKNALDQLLRPHLHAGQANLNFISGLLLFGEPVTFGPEVEERMSAVPAANNFQLLADPSRFTRRLAQLATPEIDLTAADLEHLAAELAPSADSTSAAAAPEPEEEPADALSDEPIAPTAGGFLQQKAAQLWRWLGAEDVTDLDEAPYGYTEKTLAARNHEKQELERLQASMQQELATQLRAMEAREAEREKSIAQLRQQLATAPPVASEAARLQERLAVENREKEALDAAILASRAESEARNRELDAKIQQLEQLMQRLQAAPISSPAAPGYSSASSPAPTPLHPTIRAGFRQVRAWRRRLPRLAALGTGVLAVALVVGGVKSLMAGPPTRFTEHGRWGLLEADGDTLVPARYSSISDFIDGQAVVEQSGAFGFIGKNGQEVLPPTYDALNPYREGYARVRVGDTYTFLDEDGQEFDHYYYNALDFAEGYAAVLDYRGWFYIQGPDTPAQNPKLFREAYSFHDGLARVRLADGYTFIRKSYLRSPEADTKPFGRYSSASDFADGKARVTQKGRTFYIDEDGDPVE